MAVLWTSDIVVAAMVEVVATVVVDAATGWIRDPAASCATPMPVAGLATIPW
jgi:hypothetical protein